jgi:peptide/nickel transport system ATP-binding protein
VPIADPELRGSGGRIILEGDVPNPADPPSGCHFRTRCWKAEELCARVEPPLEPRAASAQVSACHFPIEEADFRPPGETE